MKKLFEEIIKKTRANQMAEWQIEIDGQKYTRVFRPKERLILLGAGHVAQPLCIMANLLGFSVFVVDDRPSFVNKTRFPQATEWICDTFSSAIEKLEIGPCDYVAVITRGHRYDADCLRALAQGEAPFYLGMLGSKRRTSALLKMLGEEGIAQEFLQSIHTPIGLSIGALSVEEIAVSICAEMIKERRAGIDRHARSTRLTEETFHEDVVEDLIKSDKPKALMLVYRTTGSTPIKSGAFMTLDKDYVGRGTIGGGCAESQVMKEAYRLIGSKTSTCIRVSMDNDVAVEEGMVCGGQIDVWITDLTSYS